MKKFLLGIFLAFTSAMLSAANPESLNVPDFAKLIASDSVLLVDVRTPKEFAQGHIEGAINVVWTSHFLDTLAKAKLPRSKRIAVYCRSGNRSKRAAEVLVNQGYRVSELANGWLAWNNDNLFSKGLYRENQYVVLPYRDAVLGCQQTDILIVYLHDSFARGTDNEKQIASSSVSSISNYLISNGIDARLLAPQCPTDRYWTERSMIHGCIMSDVLANCISDYANQHNIKRIYLIGDAFGGAGIWRLLSKYPKLANAAMIVAAYPASDTKPANVARTPVCVIVGNKDIYASPDKSLPFIENLKKKNADIRLQLLEEDHFDTCLKAYTDDNLDWLIGK